MKLLHPRRFWREFITHLSVIKLKFQAKRKGVVIQVGEMYNLKECSVVSEGKDNCITIGDGCDLRGASFELYGSKNTIRIGRNVIMNANKIHPIRLQCGRDNATITIEDDCLFSNSITLCTTDFHNIYDKQGNVINADKNIHVGYHSWIGRSAYICKGVSLCHDTIVGAHAVVSRSNDEPYVAVAGNPAEIKKENIYWKNNEN